MKTHCWNTFLYTKYNKKNHDYVTRFIFDSILFYFELVYSMIFNYWIDNQFQFPKEIILGNKIKYIIFYCFHCCKNIIILVIKSLSNLSIIQLEKSLKKIFCFLHIFIFIFVNQSNKSYKKVKNFNFYQLIFFFWVCLS